MKKHFSTHWKSSKQPRKQRKYLANAPLHLKRKLVNANLCKELRKKYSRRSFPVRKADVVKIMRGSNKGKKGKIAGIDLKRARVWIEGIQKQKKDGTKVNVYFKPSKLQILELNLDDKKRILSLERKSKKPEVKTKVEEKETQKDKINKEKQGAK